MVMQIVNEKISRAELLRLSEHYFGDMTKGVVDVEKEVVAIDAELHADLETLLLEAGSVASADGRVIEAAGLMSNESSLTGESDSVLKTTEAIDKAGEVMIGDRVNMIYSGSLITGGRGVIVVTGTGMNTEMGKIAEMINKAEAKKTPLQKSLDSFSKKLSFGILIICAIVMAISVSVFDLVDDYQRL